MWTTLASIIPQVVSMFSSSNASDDYNKKLEQIKEQQRLSSSALQAKSLLGQNATRGLAGYETMKEDIYNTLPVTLNETRDFLSGAGVVDYLAKAKASTDQQLRQLNAANEQERNRNEQLYATYLGNTMAGYENTMQDNRNDLSLAQASMDYNKAGTLTKQLGELAKGVGSVGDLDWSKVIALLSKAKGVANSNDPISTNYTTDPINGNLMLNYE